MRYQEPEAQLFVPIRFNGVVLQDSRTGLKVGTLKMICSQHGLRMKKVGDHIRMTGPRDRMQTCLEYVHYSGLPYTKKI